jgi:hypothetical protein
MIIAKTIRRNCKKVIKDCNTLINTGHNRYQVIKVAFYGPPKLDKPIHDRFSFEIKMLDCIYRSRRYITKMTGNILSYMPPFLRFQLRGSPLAALHQDIPHTIVPTKTTNSDGFLMKIILR